jgi:hypothetical protein
MELARIERIHLLGQLQKQAMIDVSRTIGAHTQTLATLWNQGASVLRIEDREEREDAMNPIFEQISQTVNDFSVELANAHLLVEDDRLHQALNSVNEAVLMAIRVGARSAAQSHPARSAPDADQSRRSSASRVGPGPIRAQRQWSPTKLGIAGRTL